MVLKITSKWHHVDKLMPKENEYVLVATKYCRYPYITAYFNGTKWICADDISELGNTAYWCKIKTPYDNI